MTFDIGLHEVCVRVGVLYVITKFSRMDSLPNFLTHGAPLRARFARAGAPLLCETVSKALARSRSTIKLVMPLSMLRYQLFVKCNSAESGV